MALLGLLLAACQPDRPTEPTPGARSEGSTTPSPPAEADVQPPPSTHRALGPTATFEELVAAARALDEAGAGDADAGCLLRPPATSAAGWRLEADLAVAVRPLPEAPADLGARLARSEGRAAVLTRWGQQGPGDGAALALVAFTSTAPPGDRPLVVAAATEEGVHLRSTEAEPALPASRLDWSSLAEPLADLPEPMDVVITAEADMPLTRLRTLLESLPKTARPALGVALAAETKLPQPLEARTGGPALCPEGLPPLLDETPPGDMDASQATSVLQPFAEEAGRCISAFPEAAGGGRLEIHLRVGPEGRLKQTCIADDSVGSPMLRACLLERAEDLRFPETGGTVDLIFPLRLAPAPGIVQQALCR